MDTLDPTSTGRWTRYCQLREGVEGFFTEGAAIASDAMLRQQAEEGVTGDMLEIGAWHGLSALLWLAHAGPNDTVHIVDVECREPLRSNIERAGALFQLHKASSFRFPDAAFIAKHRRALRLIHIDGDHTASGITNDLHVCAELLHLLGILIVDDFLNPRFPQISEATFLFLAERRRDFAMFACGHNKAFICVAKAFDRWASFAAERLRHELTSRARAAIFQGSSENRPCLGFR